MNEIELDNLTSKYGRYPQVEDKYLVYPLSENWKSGLTHEQYKKVLGYISDNPEEILSLHIKFNPLSGDGVDDILNEIDLLGKVFRQKPKVHRILLDSDSVSVSDAIDILRVLDSNFEIDFRGDVSLTLNASSLDASEIDSLTDEGYNDFHIVLSEVVQTNEEQQEVVAKLLLNLQESHSKTIELQLEVGFAGQTVKMITDVLEKIILFHPTRIKLIQKSKNINNVRLLSAAKEFLESKEWYFIGSDLFVKDDDVWFEAVNNGKLGLNSLGFRINNSRHVLGIGIGAESFIADVYTMNTNEPNRYAEKINHGLFPVDQFHVMTTEDKIRKYVITQLICRYAVFFSDFKSATDRDFVSVFADELHDMKMLLDDGLVAVYPDRFVVTESGEWFLYYIVSYFDKYRGRL